MKGSESFNKRALRFIANPSPTIERDPVNAAKGSDAVFHKLPRAALESKHVPSHRRVMCLTFAEAFSKVWNKECKWLCRFFRPDQMFPSTDSDTCSKISFFETTSIIYTAELGKLKKRGDLTFLSSKEWSKEKKSNFLSLLSFGPQTNCLTKNV